MYVFVSIIIKKNLQNVIYEFLMASVGLIFLLLWLQTFAVTLQTSSSEKTSDFKIQVVDSENSVIPEPQTEIDQFAINVRQSDLELDSNYTTNFQSRKPSDNNRIFPLKDQMDDSTNTKIFKNGDSYTG